MPREETPAWVLGTDKQIMLRCISPSNIRRFKIATMFWREGMSVADIATALDMSESSVTMTLSRLRRKP